MDNVDKSLGKVSIGVPSKPCAFTFVPVVQNLPIKSSVTVEEASGEPHKNLTASHEETGETMSEGVVFKAVFIKDFGEGGEGNITQTAKGKLQLTPALDHVSLPESSPSVSAQSENTPGHVTSQSDMMETAVEKHGDGGISQRRCQNVPGRVGEVSSGHFLKRSSVSEDRSSPSNSADLFPTPASSRESILSECEDGDKFWWGAGLSSVTSPVSLSRPVSPCSSVRSGVFTPSVVQVKRHFLAPGSSLVNIPQTCTSSYESLSVPQSPPPPHRHRPPLTRLSLLTAILRKGRLPVLSSSLQRPYTPCWPVNPVTLSFCNACSAASSVASIPLEFSSRFSSTASIDSQNHIYRESSRCTTATPVHQSRICQEQAKRHDLNSIPRWEQVVSPPPERSLKPLKNNTLPQAPPLLFLSQYKSLRPPDHEEVSHCTLPVKLEHSHISTSKPKSPELKPSTTHMSLKGHEGNKTNTPICMSPQPVPDEDTCVPQKWTRLPHSSLSKLQSLSQKLRSPSPCPPHIHSPQPRSPQHTNAPSPLPPHLSQNTTGKYESQRDRPASTKPLRSHCLSPSRYTPIVFPGWPSPTASPSPTPSPAPPIRELTPSPSLSLRSTPSPRPGSGISDCSDREGKKRKPHKIKSSYKSLAAIPTNTLLLDQQEIDEQVERGGAPCDGLDGGVTSQSLVADTHAEMCSPAQLRQQSEELYAVIDEILGKTIPSTSRTSTTNTGVQSNSTFPKSYGRETKYASLCSLSPSTIVDRNVRDSKKTTPGVIRPMTAIPRLTVETEEKINANPFRPSSIKQRLPDKTKGFCASLDEILQDFTARSKGQTLSAEEKPAAFSACALQITESEDQISHPLKDGSRLLPPASFTPAGGKMEAFETHI